MKEIILYLLLVAFISIPYRGVKCQSAEASIPVEKISLLTDRSLYIAGEKILFATNVDDARMEQGESHVLYAELISSSGRSFVRGKYPVNNDKSDGCLTIPKDLVTGVYYVKAYTKYMRNFGPDAYAYVPLKIVNPFSEDVISGDVNPDVTGNQEFEEFKQRTFTISTDKKVYSPGESVSVSMTDSGNEFISSARLSVAVVPEFTSALNALPHDNAQIGKTLEFYPETRGISLTGKLKETSSGKILAGTRINLSIIGEGRDFMATTTDSTGQYFFSLPDYTGYRDLFLSVVQNDSSHLQLLVDNDYCSLPVHLPSVAFNLTTEERQIVYAMVLNSQITEQFDIDSLECPHPFEKDTRSFYGTPNTIIRLDDYIALPSLEEYFYELAGAVNVRKKNGHKYFKVIGDRPEMGYYEPLVLVDYVAVSNPEKILSAAPASIDRIEVINLPYVKGDITYGGIVSIISKKGDFGGIDLPSSGIFLKYNFLSDSCNCRITNSYRDGMPDTRNTVYWDPDLNLKSGSESFSFVTPHTPGKYVIVLRSIQENGSVKRLESRYEVKKQE